MSMIWLVYIYNINIHIFMYFSINFRLYSTVYDHLEDFDIISESYL